MARNRAVDIVNPERIDPEFGLLGLTEMSWSRAETYDCTWSTFACPRKYKFKYCDHEEEGWSIHLAIGSSAHDTLEWVIQNDAADETEVIGRYITVLPEHDPDNKMTDGEIADGRTLVINAFRRMNTIVPNMSDVVDVEWGFRYIIGRGIFLGFIDLIFWDEDEHGRFLHVVDYKTSGMDKKTGKPKKKTKDHGQMALYSLAVKHRFPGERVKASLYWLRAEGTVSPLDTHEFTDEELADFERKMARTVDMIVEDENYNVTKRVFICPYCSFARSDLCKFGAGVAARKKKYPAKKKKAS